MMMRPRAKRVVKTMPMAAPRSTLPKRVIHWVKRAVKMPARAAPRNIQELLRVPVRRKAMARPGRTAWLMASPIMLMRRRRRKVPGRAQAMAQRVPTRMMWRSLMVQFMCG